MQEFFFLIFQIYGNCKFIEFDYMWNIIFQNKN